MLTLRMLSRVHSTSCCPVSPPAAGRLMTISKLQVRPDGGRQISTSAAASLGSQRRINPGAEGQSAGRQPAVYVIKSGFASPLRAARHPLHLPLRQPLGGRARLSALLIAGHISRILFFSPRPNPSHGFPRRPSPSPGRRDRTRQRPQGNFHVIAAGSWSVFFIQHLENNTATPLGGKQSGRTQAHGAADKSKTGRL
ncbi:hypothetical protein MHYP_G00158890 [Metynnis hypsauchen]